jgi:hypothetical protein
VTVGTNFENGVIVKSVKARNFQSEFELTDEEAQAVSDHYPVELEIGPPAAVTTAYRTAHRRH